MPFGKLNPAVKTAISCAAIALEGRACLLLLLLLLLTPLPPSPFEPSSQEFSGQVAALSLRFAEAAHLLSVQRGRITFHLLLPFELLFLVHLVTIDPVNRAQLLPMRVKMPSGRRSQCRYILL